MDDASNPKPTGEAAPLPADPDRTPILPVEVLPVDEAVEAMLDAAHATPAGEDPVL